MKKWIAALGLVMVSVGGAAQPAPLTTLRAIHGLSNAQASHQLPVAFEATVTYYRGYESTLFVQDEGMALYVVPPAGARLVPGDRVLIQGTTLDSFHPIVSSSHITVLRHGNLPKPVAATFDQLSHAQHDCEMVALHGVVRSAVQIVRANVVSTSLQVVTQGGIVLAHLDNGYPSTPKNLLDAEVEIDGVAGGEFDGKMEVKGIVLHVSSLDDVKILKRAVASPWSLPSTPMDEIFSSHHVDDLTRRVRIQGAITYYRGGVFAVLQNGDKSLRVMTLQETPLHLGQQAEATGFPDVRDGFLTLDDGQIRETRNYAPVVPKPVTTNQLKLSKNLFDLVSMEARVVTEVSENSQDEYVLQADGYIFSAIFHRAFGEDPQARPLKKIPLGSLVRVSGVCILESSDPYTGAVPFNLLMRSFDDIVVVEEPSLLNVRNLILLVGLLLVLMTVGGVRGWSLERKVRRHAAASAESERQRSHILEGITGSQPLGEIISDIAGMVSSMLHGAPCWCEIGGDAIHGNRPPELQQLRVVQTEINARTGPGLGTLFAGLDTWTKPLPGETLALHNGARLVTLAIETRRLYADLRRRSEFDLLTDVPNRFALEKFMEAKIEWARSAGVTLGLIYIDLDKFKPVNDTYGHHVGDLYLQEVALRMNKQLLGGDMLARLGGDEFAALVTLQHCHPDLDRIVGRLQACFDEPFVVAGATIHGSASIGIALFPEDGQDREELLKVADTAMYAVKNSKQALQV